MDLMEKIRLVPDFPQKGVLFRDITTLLQDKDAFKEVIDILYERYRGKGIDKVVTIEARGYLFGGALAYRLGAGVVPIRKPQKLPWKTIREEYELEYGRNILEIHEDAIKKGEKVVIFDDVLATGGTALAACKLCERLGGEIYEVAFLMELKKLNGREKLKDYKVFAILEDER